MLQTLITGTVGLVPIYKNRPASILSRVDRIWFRISTMSCSNSRLFPLFNFWNILTLSWTCHLCMYIGHDHSSDAIEGQRSRSQFETWSVGPRSLIEDSFVVLYLFWPCIEYKAVHCVWFAANIGEMFGVFKADRWSGEFYCYSWFWVILVQSIALLSLSLQLLTNCTVNLLFSLTNCSE